MKQRHWEVMRVERIQKRNLNHLGQYPKGVTPLDKVPGCNLPPVVVDSGKPVGKGSHLSSEESESHSLEVSLPHKNSGFATVATILPSKEKSVWV